MEKDYELRMRNGFGDYVFDEGVVAINELGNVVLYIPEFELEVTLLGVSLA